MEVPFDLEGKYKNIRKVVTELPELLYNGTFTFLSRFLHFRGTHRRLVPTDEGTRNRDGQEGSDPVHPSLLKSYIIHGLSLFINKDNNLILLSSDIKLVSGP